MSQSPPKPGRVAIFATTLALLGMLIATAVFLRGDYRYMRIRNSLIIDVGEPEDFDWSGDAAPPEFHAESRVPDRFHVIASQVLHAAESPGDFEDALMLADHLVDGVERSGQRSLKLATEDAYEGILAGGGNCSDFSQVLNGLALGAGLPVREWGIFFDDFGGWGHAFNEIYDARRERWIMIDSNNSFYPADAATGEPLSVTDFLDRLDAGEGTDEITPVPIDPARYAAGARQGSQLLNYFRAGTSQRGMWFSNEVFSYDEHPLVRATRPFPAAVEQAVAILAGVHPRLRILATPDNQAAIARMYRDRNRFFVLALLDFALAVTLVVQLLRRRRAGRVPGRIAA